MIANVCQTNKLKIQGWKKKTPNRLTSTKRVWSERLTVEPLSIWEGHQLPDNLPIVLVAVQPPAAMHDGSHACVLLTGGCGFKKRHKASPLSPVARKLHSVGLGLSVLSDDHLIQEPAAASAFPIMSNPHPADLANGYCFEYKLIQLDTDRRGVGIKQIEIDITTVGWIWFCYLRFPFQTCWCCSCSWPASGPRCPRDHRSGWEKLRHLCRCRWRSPCTLSLCIWALAHRNTQCLVSLAGWQFTSQHRCGQTQSHTCVKLCNEACQTRNSYIIVSISLNSCMSTRFQCFKSHFKVLLQCFCCIPIEAHVSTYPMLYNVQPKVWCHSLASNLSILVETSSDFHRIYRNKFIWYFE